jgi:hypothetical protein
MLLLVTVYPAVQGQLKNGFDLSGALIPADDVLSGGPPRDGIPAINEPRFIDALAARFLKPTDRVLGIVRNDVAKAYPVSILNWHEIVNDSFADEPIVVTYCPLCGTGIAYQAKVRGQVLKFGVSGLLYNSDMLLYDRQTLSLWSQIRKQAVSGPQSGVRLQAIAVEHTTWADWRKRYPGSLVLSTKTGNPRDYTRNPYQGYAQSRTLYFPVQQEDKRYHPKESVLGVEIAGRFKAYPFVELEETDGEVQDKLGGKAITVKYDRLHRTAVVVNSDGELLPSITAFWFAWYAFHPDTDVYSAP